MSSGTKEIKIAATVFVIFFIIKHVIFVIIIFPTIIILLTSFEILCSTLTSLPVCLNVLWRQQLKARVIQYFLWALRLCQSAITQANGNEWFGIFNRMFRNVVVNYGTHFHIFCLFVYFSTPCCVHLLLFILCYVISQPLCNRKSH